MKHTRRLRSLLGQSLLTLSLLATPLWAQDAPAGDAQADKPAAAAEPEKDQAGEPGDEQSRRRMIRRMLTGRIERAEQAIAALDRGDSLDEIRREFWGDLGFDGGRGRFGPQDGPPDRRRGERPDGPPGDRPGWDAHRGISEWGDRPPGPEQRPEPREMTDADMEAMRSVLAQVTPRLAERMDALAQRDPAEARQRYERMFGRMRPLIDLKQGDPAMFELKVQEITAARTSWTLARSVLEAERAAAADAAKQPEAEAARARLRENLAALFDTRLAIRRHEQKMERRRFEERAAELDTAAQAKDERVDSQLDEILSRVRRAPDRGPRDEEEELGPPHSPPPPPPRGERGEGRPPRNR